MIFNYLMTKRILIVSKFVFWLRQFKLDGSCDLACHHQILRYKQKQEKQNLFLSLDFVAYCIPNIVHTHANCVHLSTSCGNAIYQQFSDESFGEVVKMWWQIPKSKIPNPFFFLAVCVAFDSVDSDGIL